MPGNLPGVQLAVRERSVLSQRVGTGGFFDNMPVNIREPKIAAGVAIGELLVVEPKQMTVQTRQSPKVISTESRLSQHEWPASPCQPLW